jgi:hypothetical protein
VAPKVWTRDAIVSAIRDWAADNGRQPKRTDWTHAGAKPDHPNGMTVVREFGSWNAAIEAAGFVPVRRGRASREWTQDNIVEAIQAWAEKYGQAPTVRAWSGSTPSHPSQSTVVRSFGSWSAAMHAAGVPVRGRGRPDQNLSSRREFLAVTGILLDRAVIVVACPVCGEEMPEGAVCVHDGAAVEAGEMEAHEAVALRIMLRPD